MIVVCSNQKNPTSLTMGWVGFIWKNVVCNLLYHIIRLAAEPKMACTAAMPPPIHAYAIPQAPFRR